MAAHMPTFALAARRSAPWLALAALMAVAGCGGSGGSKSSGGSSGGSTAPAPPPPAPACSSVTGVADPLAGYQWYLHNTGQTAFSTYGGVAGEDIHYALVTGRGAGVTIAVVDSGLEIRHADLCANVSTAPDAISHNFDPTATDVTDPTNAVDTTGDHGTSVSGVAAARSDNGIGIGGVAGRASLVGYNLLGPNTAGTLLEEGDSLGEATYSAGADVFNQSWGVDAFDAINIDSTSPLFYSDGVTGLRGQKGALYVKAAGNGFGPDYSSYGECLDTTLTCQNANMDPYNTLPQQIVVGAVNANGVRSSYSTAGSALWVSAPGGEYGYDVNAGWAPPPTNPHEVFEPAIVTTDQSGCLKGYSISPDPNAANFFEDNADGLNAGCNYTATFNGTSSATPVTSGVVALLLEANPALTWRDVKHILAATADPVDPGAAPVSVTLGDGTYVAEPGWTTNGAGYHFHDYYGFGRVNAQAAVTLAKSYAAGTWPAQADTGFLAGSVTSGTIPDNSTAGATGTVTLGGKPTFIEAVQIQVNITHAYPGDVGIELTSPAGTRSVLLTVRNAFGASTANFVDWVALSNAFYGETSNGAWTLKVVDGAAPDAGSLTSWGIRIFGH